MGFDKRLVALSPSHKADTRKLHVTPNGTFDAKWPFWGFVKKFLPLHPY